MAIRSATTAPATADLYSTIITDKVLLILLGDSAIEDQLMHFWYYDASSMATDNGTTVIKPTAINPANPGRYLLLANAPIPADWNAVSGFAQIANKPTIPDAQVNSDWNSGSGLSQILNKPTIPAAQVNSDWNSGSGISQILNKPTIPSTTRTTSTLTLSLVGTGATGTQISSTLPSSVRVTVSTSTTSTIGGPATSIVTLKKCATNSATEGDWTSVAIFESDQTITLAIALQSVQVVKGQLSCDLDAAWFVKLVNSGSGTHSEAFVSGEKTIYG